MNRMIVALSAAALLALAAGASHAESEKPDATLEFSGSTVAAGVGYTWGEGALHYEGMDYPFAANGLELVGVGAAKIEATGKVFHLTKAEDFPGTFAAVTAGVTIATGEAGTAMRNENGVVVYVHSKTEGLNLQLAPSGFVVAFAGPPAPTPGSQ